MLNIIIADILNGKTAIDIKNRTARELLSLSDLFDKDFYEYFCSECTTNDMKLWEIAFHQDYGWDMTNLGYAEKHGVNNILTIEEILNSNEEIVFDI